MDSLQLIYKYYPEENSLRNLLIHHSRQVRDRALHILDAHPEIHADRAFVAEAAMLHDVGVFLTDAPSIYCHGSHPYLMHGYLGGQLMREEGLPDIARVCERHTGTGLTAAMVGEMGLPIPRADYCPETTEEQLICYADKFYSKSHPLRVRSVEQTAQALAKYGSEGVRKFWRWVQMFEPEHAPASCPDDAE